MKKLINVPDDVVVEALRGGRRPPLARRGRREQGGDPRRVRHAGQGRPRLRRRVGPRALARRLRRLRHARRRLPGEVFTSPVPDQMLPATQKVDGGAGVLHIVKNYTGDVLNFQMAAELAADENIEVTRSSSTTTSPCRTASTPRAGAARAPRPVEKIAGALAE